MPAVTRTRVERMVARSVSASMRIERRSAGRAPRTSESFVKGSAIAAIKAAH